MEKKKRKLGIGTVLGVCLCIILIPVIVINVVLIVGTYIHPQEMPGIFGIKPVIVLSGSMEPEFSPGDLIFIRKEDDTAALQQGDVICYLLSGKAVTHRITQVTKAENGEVRYITKGDANNSEDQEEVAPSQVQGKYTGVHLAKVGDFALFMQSTTGMILFIICPLVLFILWDILQRFRADQKEKSRTAELEAELAELKASQKKAEDAASGKDIESSGMQ